MTNMNVHYSSKSNEWETPIDLFNRLNDEFHFNLDAAATHDNHLCDNYFTIENDALKQDWTQYKSIFVNPPYSRLIGKFVEKAYNESKKNCIIVMLIPARTCTKFFHNYIMKSKEIRFIKGRCKFVNRSFPRWRADGNFKVTPAPFPSMIVVFDGKDYEMPKISSWIQ